jgi:hypothetical protein
VFITILTGNPEDANARGAVYATWYPAFSMADRTWPAPTDSALVTVTTPLSKSTEISSTPSIEDTSSVTERTQWAHVIPVTVYELSIILLLLVVIQARNSFSRERPAEYPLEVSVTGVDNTRWGYKGQTVPT